MPPRKNPDEFPSESEGMLPELEEPFPEGPIPDFPLDDEMTVPGGVPLDLDTYEDSKLHKDPRRQIQAMEVAPEVSQGAWRERAFVPRGVMPKEQVLGNVDRALKLAAMQRGQPVPVVRTAAKIELQPLLRQAVEQAGGDGLDAHLSKLIAPPGRSPRDTLVQELGAAFERVNRAKDHTGLLGELKRVRDVVDKAFSNPAPKRVSLKVLEKELEGRIEVDALLSILFSTDEEVGKRLTDVERTLENLRTQLRGMPGHHPDGLMWNFSRLKVEKRILEAEQRRRSPRG